MTRISIALLAILSMCHPASAQTPNQTLASFVDKNRVLLVFAPTDQDPRLHEQLNLLSHHSQDMKERDLILIPVPMQSGPPTTPDTLRTLRPPIISASEQLTLHHRFRVAPRDFAAILLGKDGGEKLRSATPISIERLNGTIDAMPMRRQEMREPTPKP